MIQPKGSKIIKIDWLQVEVLLIKTKIQLQSLLKNNTIRKGILNINDWDSYHGKVIAFDNKNLRYYIIIIKRSEHNTIVHESVHLAEFILTDHGIKAEGDTLAYMVEHIFNQII